LLFVPAAIRAQSNWDRYLPGTLASIIRANERAIHDEAIPGRPGNHFPSDQSPTIASVIYVGDSRPITPIRRKLIRDWGASFRRDTSIVLDFHREYLFDEAGRKLWIPVQDTVASFFKRELRPGQPAKIYVMLLGGYYAGRDIVWGFIVNEFSAEGMAR
jgi:hypothetical protein